MRRIGARLLWLLVLPACNQLLGISNPTAGDATAPDGPRPDGEMPDAALDAPPACTTATSFGGEITSAVGGAGVALTVGRYDAGTVNDVAIAITTDTVIMLGSAVTPGSFTVSQTLLEPAIALVTEDYDMIGARDDLVLLTATSAVVRQQSESGAAGVFLAAQTIDTFTNADRIATAQFGLGFADLVIHDDTGNIAYTSLGAAGTFSKEDTIGAGGDRVVFAGEIDRANRDDVITVDATGNVSLALSNGTDSFDPPTVIATGATGLGVGVGRFDDDVFLDVIVATSTGGEVYLQNSASPGVFTKQTGTFGGILSTVPLLVGDVNGDGLDDVISPTTVTLQCPTTRVFTQVESIDATNAVLGDVSGDTKLDLLRLSGTDLIVRLQ